LPVDINLMVGGEAGQGVQSVGFLLAKMLARGGYHVFADQDLESRIRGGHNFFRVRAKDNEVGAPTEKIDVLLALNRETMDLHRSEMSGDGVVVFDSEKVADIRSNGNLFGVPLARLAEEQAGNRIMSNVVTLGAALCLAGYDFAIVEQVLRDYFGKDSKGEANVKAAAAGYHFAKENFPGDFKFHLGRIGDRKQMLLNGADAISVGAIAAGCKFISAYPMTPTTPILEYMAAKGGDYGIVVVQTEDEIAAVNMAIGAGYAGVRSMTATSGSGFCLMVEGLGLAGITETPVVIVLGQRPGPAVGLPTRTEQGDLQFVLTAHHGDFPRAVLAASTVEDSFWMTIKAFNLAEKYQIPVIVMTDHYLSTVYNTVNSFDLSKIQIDRGELFDASKSNPEEYLRHKITASGISPRAFPGLSKALVVTDADEHDEAGHLIESAEIRKAQMDKRLRKMVGLAGEIAPPYRYGPIDAKVTFIGWGSTYGAIREAVDILNKDKHAVNLLHFSELWPFPAAAVISVLHNKRVIAVENNATGQLARLVRAETGQAVDAKILRYDGRPITAAFIIDKFRKEAG
jgi:2-oxoglutarate ferredoxin oxidoreductase subunit alpha